MLPLPHLAVRNLSVHLDRSVAAVCLPHELLSPQQELGVAVAPNLSHLMKVRVVLQLADERMPQSLDLHHPVAVTVVSHQRKADQVLGAAANSHSLFLQGTQGF